ncbi:sigma-54-dependent transcriptional regulator [Anaeromicropila herbilytica]|uniref:Transcriptional regulator n=1 Tax=Anaeromicropila herbilytica TaxID=2785025 RepID=A0A7R7ICE0_9FIRM|nr:sigma-54-dependent transcriptional regulator [Anaeromicropila herbilytica]BCN29766.1 transcriptional regulator [Anaeromicropila herbilytica]
MENGKIKVLGIAPYEAMKTAIERLAKNRTDMKLDAYVGDLSYGKELVNRHIEENYDVIISRGGTARLIEEITEVPVVEISLSVYDILRAIKLAENYQERYAIIGFSNITSSAHLLCDLLQYRVDIFTVHSAAEVRPLLTKLKIQGYHMVVCDMISHTEAKLLGLNAILITSGAESIEDAFNQAVKISTTHMKVHRENQFIKEVLKNSGNYTVIFDSEENIYFSTWDKKNETEVYDFLRQELPNVKSLDSHKIFHNIEGTLFSIVGCTLPYEGQQYVIFYFTDSKIPITPGKYGIRFSNKKEAEEHFFNSFYRITGAMGDLADSINQISQSSFPVMIIGENGTGKDQIARVLYTQSTLQSNPMVTIDCSQLTDKGWTYLTNHYNSPFNDNNNTIYFKSIEALDPERSHQLLSTIIDTNLHRRNRVIFSCISQRDSLLPPEGQDFVTRLSCLTICLPTLRERIQELPTLSSIYLSTLNVSLGKQLAGFEPKAMEMLMQYDWPQNYTQFKRLTRELAVLTITPYITSNSVAILLDKERSSINGTNTSPVETSMDLTRPLEEITRDIIKKAVAVNHGNQSLTAKQLQISRTTLWRYLRE